MSAKVSPDEPQGKRQLWLTRGRFVWFFFGVMYLLTTLALIANQRSAGDVVIGAPITALLETLVLVTVLRLGFCVFSRLPSRKR